MIVIRGNKHHGGRGSFDSTLCLPDDGAERRQAQLPSGAAVLIVVAKTLRASKQVRALVHVHTSALLVNEKKISIGVE